MGLVDVFPQTVRFGVLSWQKGTRRARWVAHGSELGARGIGCVERIGAGGSRTGWVAGGSAGGPQGKMGGTRIGWGPRARWVARGSELGARGRARRAPTQRAPGLDRPCRVSPRAVMPIARLPCWSSFAQKQKLHNKSPLSPPIHAQIRADLSTVQGSGGCVFLWRTIP